MHIRLRAFRPKELEQMCIRLFLAWQSSIDHSWHVIGRLDQTEKRYRFVYTQGVMSARTFLPLLGLSDINKIYESEQLFPIFANRLLSRTRPEFSDFVRWLELDGKTVTAMEMLARSEAIKVTDTFQVFPDVRSDEYGNCEVIFFAHQIPQFQDVEVLSQHVQVGDALKLHVVNQNHRGENAVALCRRDSSVIVGYLPRYLAVGFSELLDKRPGSLSIKIKQINQDAPRVYQILCSLSYRDGIGNRSIFNGTDFQPLVEVG